MKSDHASQLTSPPLPCQPRPPLSTSPSLVNLALPCQPPPPLSTSPSLVTPSSPTPPPRVNLPYFDYRTGNIYGRSEAMKRYIGTCLPHAGRYMQSRTGAVTQVSILPQSFFCYCRITFLLLPHHFFAIAASFFANCNEKIAAPHRTRVTNATEICRTSLVARYAAPPALRVTRQHNILPVRYSDYVVRMTAICWRGDWTTLTTHEQRAWSCDS